MNSTSVLQVMWAFVFCAVAVASASDTNVYGNDHWEDDSLSMLQWGMRRVSEKFNPLTFDGEPEDEGGYSDSPTSDPLTFYREPEDEGGYSDSPTSDPLTFDSEPEDEGGYTPTSDPLTFDSEPEDEGGYTPTSDPPTLDYGEPEDEGAFDDGEPEDEGGYCDLLVIPRGASHRDSLLRVTASIDKIGEREADLWIRRIKLSGRWLPQNYIFKTASASYGDDLNYLVRVGKDVWQRPMDIVKSADGLMSVAIHNKSLPTQNFQKSPAQDISLLVGPVTVGITYATSNKDNVNFNHLDIHLQGLTAVKQPLGGLLCEQQPEGDTLSLLSKFKGSDQVQLQGPQNSPDDDKLQLAQSSTPRSRNTLYTLLPSPSGMKFDWCCQEGKCEGCHWQ